MRATSSLSPGLPATMAAIPDSSFARAASEISSRSPALRCCSSGPWQLQQWFRQNRPDLATEINFPPGRRRCFGCNGALGESESEDRGDQAKTTTIRSLLKNLVSNKETSRGGYGGLTAKTKRKGATD